MAKKRKNDLANSSEVKMNNTNQETSSTIGGSVFIETQSNQGVFQEIKDTMNEGTYREKLESLIVDNDEGADAEVFKDKKLKKKKKKTKKTYEHTTWAHKMRVLATLLVLGVFTGSGLGVWYFNFELRSKIDYGAYNPADYIQTVNETFEANNINATESSGATWLATAKGQGLTPADLTPADNFILAEHNLKFATTYNIEGIGYVDSTGVRQSIISRKKFNGDYYTFESISPSKISFISDIILCDKYVKGQKTVSIYNSKNTNPTTSDWTFLEEQTTNMYLATSGNLPNAVQPYIISSKTVINDTNMKENVIYNSEDSTYTFSMELEPTTSVLNYAKQVKRTGGLGSYPEFTNLTFTVTIDKDWNLISFNIKENYSAVKGIRARCSGVLNYTVTINGDVEMPV